MKRALPRPLVFLLGAGLITLALGRWIDADGLFALLQRVTPLEYLALSALGALLLVPGVLSKTAAGVLFGMKGIPLAFVGAFVGSSVVFAFARILRRLGLRVRKPKLVRFDDALAEQGARLVFLLRLSPLVPFNVLNYALGLGGVSYRACAIGGVGMLPTSAVYAYGGAMVHALGDTRPWWHWFALVAGLVASGLAALRIRHAARVALADELAPREER